MRLFSVITGLVGIFLMGIVLWGAHGWVDQSIQESIAFDWSTPLDTGHREDWNSLLVSQTGHFLAERTSYRGMQRHIHTGDDFQNRYGGGPGESIYAVARGRVHDVRIQGAATRVTIEHLLPWGEFVFTSYIHIAGVKVRKGQWVDSTTVIARRLNAEELEKYGKFFNHLHFQIHKSIFVAEHTIDSKTPEEVKRRFYEPLKAKEFDTPPKEISWREWLQSDKRLFLRVLGFSLS